MKVGDIIKYWRNEFGYTQRQFADLIGNSQQNVSRWEANKNIPSIIECVKMARALKLSLDEMFEDLDVD